MTLSNKMMMLIAGAIALFLAGLGSGLTIGWKTWQPRLKPAEITEKSQVMLKDSSKMLARTTILPENVDSFPKIATPSGYLTEKKVFITIHDSMRYRPDTIHVRDTEVICPPCPAPKVTLLLVKGPDGRRVIAKASDGFDLQGIDIPNNSATAQSVKIPAWAIGVTYQPFPNIAGIRLSHDIAWLRLSGGASIQPSSGWKSVRPVIGADIVF